MADASARVYIVHMKQYSVARARDHLAEVLDTAEQGEEVIIERRGIRFAVKAVTLPVRTRSRAVRVEFIDPEIESGNWSWSWSPSGTVLKSKRKRRTARS